MTRRGNKVKKKNVRYHTPSLVHGGSQAWNKLDLRSRVGGWVGVLLVAPLDCNPPCSSVHGISQARILERVAISFSRRSYWPRDWTCVSCTAGGFFTHWATNPNKREGTNVKYDTGQDFYISEMRLLLWLKGTAKLWNLTKISSRTKVSMYMGSQELRKGSFSGRQMIWFRL